MPDYSLSYTLGLKDLASKQLERFKAAVGETRKELTKMLTSGSAFSSLQTSIQGVVGAASPRVMAEWNASWFALQATIGRLFIPVVREASAKIIEVARWVKSLTDKQKENILYWTKVALAVTGVFFVFAKLKPLIVGLFSVATSPFLLALAAAAGLIGGMLNQMEKINSEIDTFTKKQQDVAKGNITEDDKQNPYYKYITETDDEGERSTRAKKMLDGLQPMIEESNKKMGKWDTGWGQVGRGASRFFHGTDGAFDNDKEEWEGLQKRKAIAMAFLKTGGKDLTVKEKEKEGSSDMSSMLLGGQSSKVSSGGAAEQWRALQGSISIDPQTMAINKVFGSIGEFHADVNKAIRQTDTGTSYLPN